VTARRRCSGNITGTPAPDCDIGSGPSMDPNYSHDSGSTSVQNVPNCRRDDLIRLSPGRYTDLAGLNRITSNACRDTVLHFTPGTYYFDFDGRWDIDSGWVVGGAATQTFVGGTAPSMPGACQSPIPPSFPAPPGWTRQTGGGVQFVFGESSRIAVGHAEVELCGTYSETRPPIALYGLKNDVGPVDAQDDCVTDITFGCAVITTDNSPDSLLYVQGTTYMPRARIDVSLNNNTGQVFRYGVIARSLAVNPTASANLDRAVIEVPDDVTPFGRRTVVYLNVYVCPGANTCSASGRLRLRAKVGIIDPSGTATAGEREMTVYSWSVQR
jgi:hypothetical protein